MKLQELSYLVLSVIGLIYRPISGQADLYPFGEQTERDLSLRRANDVSSGLVLTGRTAIRFGLHYNQFCVNDNGVISFENEYSKYQGPQPAFPIGPDEEELCRKERTLIAPFWANVDITAGGNIYYGLNDTFVNLNRAAEQIRRSWGWPLEPEQLVIVTYDRVSFYGVAEGHTLRNTFQCVIASDTWTTYAIFLYKQIEWTTGIESNGGPENGIGGTPAQVGFNAGDGFRSWSHPYSRDGTRLWSLVTGSNVNEPGVWVYDINDLY